MAIDCISYVVCEITNQLFSCNWGPLALMANFIVSSECETRVSRKFRAEIPGGSISPNRQARRDGGLSDDTR